MKQIFVLGQKNSGVKEIGEVIKDWGIEEVEMDDISKKMLQHIQDNTGGKNFVTLARLEREFAKEIEERLQGDFFVADDWSIKTHRIYKRYCNPVCVIMLRNPVDLARELAEVIGDFEKALSLVSEEDNLLLEAIKLLDSDRIYISYDEYMRDEKKVLKKLKDFIKP